MVLNIFLSCLLIIAAVWLITSQNYYVNLINKFVSIVIVIVWPIAMVVGFASGLYLIWN